MNEHAVKIVAFLNLFGKLDTPAQPHLVLLRHYLLVVHREGLTEERAMRIAGRTHWACEIGRTL